MNLYEKIKNKQEKLSIICLEYVGLSLVISFAKKAEVVGCDINKEKVEAYKGGWMLLVKWVIRVYEKPMLF